MSDTHTSPDPISPPRKIRWWGLWVILGLGLIAGLVIAFTPVSYVQQRVMLGMISSIVMLVVLAVWWFGLSGATPNQKLKVGLVLLLLAALLPVFFRLEGTSGDLIPRVGWRFAEARTLSELPAPNAAGPEVPVDLPGAADFTQFLGSTRNCHVPEVKWDTDWTKHRPELLWKIEVGEGWGGFAVKGGYAITQEQRGEFEMVVCYALATGKVVWAHKDEARFEEELGGIGPRGTPTIVAGKVYTMGATGMLNCLELATGKLLWGKNVIEQTGSSIPTWGVACSPLVVGDSVIVVTGNKGGATLASYATETGLRQWIIGTQEASYSSPIIGTVSGVQMILYFGPKEITGHDPLSGKQLWSYPWMPELKQPHVAVPIITEDQGIVISSGYGKGSMKIRLTQADGIWKAEEEWKTNRMKAKFSNPVEFKGHIYGLDDGTFACLDHMKGELKWRDGNYLHGQTLLLEPGLMLSTSEKGYVVLIEPSPDGLKEIARFQALPEEEKTWNPPALAGKYLLMRNDQSAACYRLPVL